MIQTLTLSPGVTLRCYNDRRFKQGRLTLQLVRPMCRQEAGLNALLPAVLLRGTAAHPDLRAVTMHLDDLYGATVGDLVRRIGDYQTTGFSCSFPDDRFALEGDSILAPVVDFLRELLLQPLLEDGAFSPEIVESEKKNLIAAIDSVYNDKQAYSAGRLMRLMCREDSFGVPRLGQREDVAAITPQSLYDHYKKLLRVAPVELFYVGAAPAQEVARLLGGLFEGTERSCEALPPQSPFRDAGGQRHREESDVTQSILNMGFVTDATVTSPDFAATQVLNTLLGAGMTSKLFVNVREKLSLCYSIGSHYYAAKGIVTVSAGIDAEQEETVRREILAQLDSCRRGDITEAELAAAKEALISSLRTVHDSPGAIEGYYGVAALSGLALSPRAYTAAVEQVSVEDAAAAAAKLRQHSAFFLKGVAQ